MASLKQIGSNTFVVFLTKVLNLGLTLLFTIFIARFLGKESLGIFSFALVFVYFFSIIADFGLQPIVVRELSKGRYHHRSFFANAIILKVSLIIAALLPLYFSIITVVEFDPQQKYVILILSVIIFFSPKISGLRRLLETPFQVELKMAHPSKLQLLDMGIAICLIALFSKSDLNIIGVTMIYTFATIPGFLILFRSSFRKLKPKWRIRTRALKMLIKVTYPLALYTAGIAIINNLDVLLIKIFLTDGELGYYAAASRLITPLNFIPAAIVSSLFPLMSKFAQTDSSRLKQILSSSLKVFLFAGIIVTILGLIWAEKIILLLYGDEFRASVIPFKIFVCSITFMFIHFFLVDFYTANGKQRLNQQIVLFLLLLNIPGNLILIPLWGINGASGVRLFTNVVGALILTSFSLNYLEWDSKVALLKLILLGMILVLSCTFLNYNRVLESFLMLMGFLMATHFLKIFSERELSFFKNQILVHSFRSRK